MTDTIIESLYDFRKVTVPEKLLELKVSEEAIGAEMDRAALRFATIEAMDGPIERDDFVRVELPGQEGPEVIQINVGRSFVDEVLENALPGMCQGDETALSLTGKKISIRVLSVKRRVIPQLTDELVQKLDLEGISTIQDHRDYIIHQIEGQAKRQKIQALCGFVSKAAAEKSIFAPINEDNSDFCLLWSGYKTQAEAYAAQSGQSADSALAQMLRMNGKPVETCWDALREQCIGQVKLCAMGRAYALEDGVTYTRETVRQRYQEYAGQTGIDPSQIPDDVLDSGLIQLYMEYFSQKIAGYYMDRFHTELVQ